MSDASISRHPPGGAQAQPAATAAALREERWTGYLHQIREGGEDGLARLYDESSPLVFGLALRMLGNREDAEEVAADVYAHVWRSAASWDRQRGNISTWLVMLCRSRCIDRIRSRAGRRSVEESLNSEVPVDGRPVTHGREFIQQVLRRLEPADRRLIEAAFFHGLTHTELAAEMGLPLGTVKTRIRTVVLKMRNLSKGCYT